MTTQPPAPPPAPKLPPRLVRELVGLALLVVGVLVLVVCAWRLSPWLAVTAGGAALVAGGLTLVTTSNAADEG